MSMIPNIGIADRILRLVAGLVLLVVALLPGFQVFGTGAFAWVAGIVGLVLLATGTMRLCPLYGLLGISTRPNGQSR